MNPSRISSLFETLRSTRFRSSGLGALRVIGLYQFLRLWFHIALNLPRLLSQGREPAMRRVSFAMGRGRPLRLKYHGASFLFDCEFCDRHDPSAPSFQLVQEMLIRDSYFAFHPEDAFSKARTVVDLGANRGLFSLTMASRAERVVSVECLSDYAVQYEHNMKLNGFKNSVLEKCFIGEAPPEAGPNAARMGMKELLDKHGLETVDFLKVDIEGGEFAVFREKGWLSRVRYLSMEVHFDAGTLRELCDCLREAGFTYRITSWDLQPIDNPDFHGPPNCCLLFAQRVSGTH